MIAYFDYSSTSFRKPRQVYKAIKAYRKYGVKDVVYNKDLREENIHVNSVVEFKIILE